MRARLFRYHSAISVVAFALVLAPQGAALGAPGSAPGQLTPPGQLMKLEAATQSSPGKAALHNPHLLAATSAHQDPAECDGDPTGHSNSGHGANQSGPYNNTCPAGPSLNGQGGGQATGRPCAGCVGQADDKNPRGQLPGPSDGNQGYECDGNKGIARGNPAHTGCTSTPAGPPPPPVTASASAVSCDTDGQSGPDRGTILVAIANASPSDVAVTIAGVPAVVGANSVQAGSYLVVVRKVSDGSIVLSQVVVVADCSGGLPQGGVPPGGAGGPSVLGTKITRPLVVAQTGAVEVLGMRLARTGTDPIPLVLAALCLLAAGVVIERSTRSASAPRAREWNWALVA